MAVRLVNLMALGSKESAPVVPPEEVLALLDVLPEGPTPEQVLSVMGRFRELLKNMDDISREIVREGAVKRLRVLGFACPTRLVDAAMPPPVKGGGNARTTGLQDPDLWPEAVNGAALLNAIEHTIRRFVALAPEQAVPFALWVLFTHCHDAFEVSPILAFTSPDKGCGKSTALALLSALVPRPLTSANITPSAVFRAADYYKPCLLLDEADTFLHDADGLRGILNSGHMRTQAYVTRVVGDDHGVCMFSTWTPKAIAMIGQLPPTLADRSVTIRMRRRDRSETIERLQLHRLGDMEDLRSMAARWAHDHMDALRLSDPQIPETISKDRARDNWRSLLAIADMVGSEWPARARSSATQLSCTAGNDTSSAILLLEDLRALFSNHKIERLSSETILQHLHKMEERPWPEWRDRGPMTARQLALLLTPFGITPVKWKEEGVSRRGYERDAFRETFSRYLPHEAPQPPPASLQRTYGHPQSAPESQKGAVRESANSSIIRPVAEGAVQNGESRKCPSEK